MMNDIKKLLTRAAVIQKRKSVSDQKNAEG